MTTDRVGRLLERVAERMIVDVVPDKHGYISKSDIFAALEERLGPLLRAGQAMHETLGITYPSHIERGAQNEQGL